MSGFVTVVFTAPGKNVNLCCSLSGMEPTLLQSNVIGEVAQLMDVAGLNLHYAMLPYNVEKQMRLYGSGLITGAFWLTKEDTECDDVENRLPLAGEQNVITFAEHQSTDFSMRPLAQDSTYTLCYSYRNDPALSYKKYVFYPISVTSIVAREKGKDDLAVVGAEKSFNIFGSHLSTADYLGWSRNENCSDMVPIAEGDGFYTPLLQDASGQLYFTVTFRDNSKDAPDQKFYYCFNSNLNGNLPVNFRMTVYELLKTQWSQGAAAASEESVALLGEEQERLSVKAFDMSEAQEPRTVSLRSRICRNRTTRTCSRIRTRWRSCVPSSVVRTTWVRRCW